MSIKFSTANAYRRGDSFYLDIADIDINAENNGRQILPDISGLIESIRANGQQTPCLVRKDGQRAVMVEGHSRWRAIVEINKGLKAEDRRKVWCVPFSGNEQDALIAGFEANSHRNTLTPIDEGYFVKRMLSYGRDYDSIAAIMRRDVSDVKELFALVNLVPEAQKDVAAGKIKPNAAKVLARMSSDLQREALTKTDKHGNVTAGSVKAVAKAAAPAKPTKATPLQLLNALRELHDTIVLTVTDTGFDAPPRLKAAIDKAAAALVNQPTAESPAESEAGNDA